MRVLNRWPKPHPPLGPLGSTRVAECPNPSRVPLPPPCAQAWTPSLPLSSSLQAHSSAFPLDTEMLSTCCLLPRPGYLSASWTSAPGAYRSGKLSPSTLLQSQLGGGTIHACSVAQIQTLVAEPHLQIPAPWGNGDISLFLMDSPAPLLSSPTPSHTSPQEKMCAPTYLFSRKILIIIFS